MANTPTSKVIFGTETLIDLTGDTAEAGDVLLGKSFHLPSGAQGTGTLNPALKEDIADVEPSSTASAAHASGTYLYYNNVLYKATADIAQGDSIVTSGASQNVELVTVGGELVTLNTSLAQEKIARAKNGAHNLMPLSLSVLRARNTYGTWSGNTFTQNNVSFAVATDANGNVTGITVNGNGSNTSAVYFVLTNSLTDCFEDSGNYVLRGCPSGGSVSGYTLSWRKGLRTDNSYIASDNDTGEGVDLPALNSAHNIYFYICVGANTAVSNKVFKPMVSLASDPVTDFTPYAMTNTELTKYRLKTLIMSNVTTDNNGRFNIDLPDSNTVVAIYEASGNKIMPYVYDGIWRGMVIDSTGTTVIARTNININVTIKYI